MIMYARDTIKEKRYKVYKFVIFMMLDNYIGSPAIGSLLEHGNSFSKIMKFKV